MKILHIVWGLENGGAENMLADIINVQLRTEQVTLLVINNMLDKSILNRINNKCQFIFLNRKIGSKNPLFILRLNLIILFGRYDIIHLHQNTTIKVLFVPANYVRTVHNTHQDTHNYRWHKGIIAISNSVKKELDTLGYTNSILINNGIDFDSIKHSQKSKTNGVFNVVQVSRIIFRQKGQDILLKIIKQVIQKGYNIHLDYIGDGPDFIKLKDMVDRYKLSSYVSLLGDCPRDYIYNNLYKYDLFVQPSRFEGFGLTVVEAMAAKVPVLVSRNEGPLQIIENGKFGFSFENENILDASEKIIDIINNYPDYTFLNNAYEHARSLYSVEKTALSYINEYKKILKK